MSQPDQRINTVSKVIEAYLRSGGSEDLLKTTIGDYNRRHGWTVGDEYGDGTYRGILIVHLTDWQLDQAIKLAIYRLRADQDS